MLQQEFTSEVDDTFLINQLNSSFSNIKILDQSIDKDAVQRQVVEYYRSKFSSLPAGGYLYPFIDLFCGAGGLSVGLEQEGFRPIAAVDKDKSAILTYQFNRPWLSGSTVIQEDIRDLAERDVFPQVPLVVGGPPCQGFSVANKHKRENDERNELYKFYLHSVGRAKADIFLMENVEGILQLYDSIRDSFERIGYLICAPVILNTKDFGFPQNRKRAFILGLNVKYQSIAEELYRLFGEGLEIPTPTRRYSLWDAISDLPTLEAKTIKNATYSESRLWGYTYGGLIRADTEYTKLANHGLSAQIPLLNHRSKYNNDRDIQIFRLLQPGEQSDAESIQEINPYKSRAGVFRDKYNKLRADEPCKAITAHMYYDCNTYIHPTQARGLTPREAARVQGFPDDYLFLGSPNEWYRQIGNAVSPLMARLLAAALRRVLERIYRV